MFKKISTILFVSIVIEFINDALSIEYLVSFFENNLVLMLVALAAINSTTLGVVMTKLREVSLAYHSDFSETIKEMRFSIKEQLALILLSLLIQMVNGSSLLFIKYDIYIKVSNTLLIAIFLYALYILYDTMNMIFEILNFENEEIINQDRD